MILVLIAPIVLSAVGSQALGFNDDSHLYGSNVCIKQETHPYKVLVETQVPYNIPVKKCVPINPGVKCSFELRTGYRKSYRNETRFSVRTIRNCCKGFIETTGLCVPLCVNGCIHGLCIAPNTCRCRTGYNGFDCNKICQNNKWGHNCENYCNCENNSTCDPVSGKCTCASGWWQDDCSTPCDQGFYGYDCAEICRCGHGVCDHITGVCDCDPGYSGPLCTETIVVLSGKTEPSIGESQLLKDINQGYIIALLLLTGAICFIVYFSIKLVKITRDLYYVLYLANTNQCMVAPDTPIPLSSAISAGQYEHYI